MNLLQIVQAACGEIGVQQPNAVATTTDPQIMQFLALANGLGMDLIKLHQWQALSREASITTAAGQESYPLPSDYGYEVPQTEWDKTNHWPLQGPKSAQEWQWLKSGIISAGPRYRFRIMGGVVKINPAPQTDGSELSFEYIGKHWVMDQDGVTSKPRLVLDTDTCLFDDRLMIAGLKAKWLAAKGFDSTIAQAEYMNTLDLCKAQDSSAPTLTLSRRQSPLLLSTWSIPETGYGS